MDERSKYLRKLIVRLFETGRRGHIASAFSIVEILRVLYDDIFTYNPQNPRLKNRDRFILSKGHGCLALYALLFDKGFIKKKDFASFCQENSLLGGHPEADIPGVEASTGSLGHGPSIGVGMAIAVRQLSEFRFQYSVNNNKNDGFRTPSSEFRIPRVFVLVGDGEMDEGSVWEALLSASKHKLVNYTLIIDYNKLQSYDKISLILPLEPLKEKLEAFGFNVNEANGHDPKNLSKIFRRLPFSKNKPSAVICHTVKGYGVEFTQNNLSWHHRRGVTDEEIRNLYNFIDNQ